jgi:hypothetical protein
MEVDAAASAAAAVDTAVVVVVPAVAVATRRLDQSMCKRSSVQNGLFRQGN